MSKLERWTVAPGGLTQHPLGECVLTVDHLAEIQQLQEQVRRLELAMVNGNSPRVFAEYARLCSKAIEEKAATEPKP